MTEEEAKAFLEELKRKVELADLANTNHDLDKLVELGYAEPGGENGPYIIHDDRIEADRELLRMSPKRYAHFH